MHGRWLRLLVSLFFVVGLSDAARAVGSGTLSHPSHAVADDTEELKTAAQGVVERLARGEFDAVAATFAQELTQAMPVEKLRDAWQSVVKRSGAFQQVAEVRSERRGTGDYMMVTCAFAERRYDLRLLFTKKRQLAALRFVPTALGGPGLIRATCTATVQPVKEGAEGMVTFPVPGTYRDQVPLDFIVKATPPEALNGYRLRQREDGMNWLCEVRVAPPKDGALLRWEALVLVNDRSPEPLPKADAPEVPEEAKPWLKSTGCVQSADPAIKAKADELAKDAPDLETYARRVIKFTGNNPVKTDRYYTLDARNALDCGGSCTSRANLAAALLRARGIPARTVAHLPTWCGPLYEHWLVEYWHPGKGWVWLESSLNQFQPAPSTLVVLNVANPADEDHPTTFASVRIRGVMGGAPYLSVQEISPQLLPAFQLRTGEEVQNLATPEVTLRGSSEELRALFQAAEKAFAQLPREHGPNAPAGQAEALVSAARTGGVKLLLQTLSR